MSKLLSKIKRLPGRSKKKPASEINENDGNSSLDQSPTIVAGNSNTNDGNNSLRQSLTIMRTGETNENDGNSCLDQSPAIVAGNSNVNDGNNSLGQSPTIRWTAASDITPWERAYQIMMEQQPELMRDYMKHIRCSQGETPCGTGLFPLQSVEPIVDRLLKDREKKQWQVSILGKDIKVREHAENLVKFLLWTDPIVKGALSGQPYAALAWSGVSLLLPVSRAFHSSC